MDHICMKSSFSRKAFAVTYSMQYYLKTSKLIWNMSRLSTALPTSHVIYYRYFFVREKRISLSFSKVYLRFSKNGLSKKWPVEERTPI